MAKITIHIPYIIKYLHILSYTNNATICMGVYLSGQIVVSGMCLICRLICGLCQCKAWYVTQLLTDWPGSLLTK